MKIRNLLQLILLLLVALGFPIAAKATHIVGGEIGYRCLGNNQYEITLKVYRDCYNGKEDFDRPAYLGIYNLEGDLIQKVAINFSGIRDTLNPALNDPCLVVPPNVCVDTTTYRTIVTLPPDPIGGAYQITYVRCCRNKIIDNIVAPEEVGAVYDIFLTTDAMERCNTSPVFNNLPPNYICANKPFVFDHSATDPDGDILVYSLCTPYSGGSITNPKPIPTFNPTNNAPPYDEVQWAPGFGLDNLFGAGEPLKIDPQTGIMTATPGIQGTFVVGVCVDEFDPTTGQWLSRTRRDFQYDVGICGEVVSSAFTPSDTCGLTVKFTNNSTNSANYLWYFDYPNTNLTSTQTSPSFTYSAPGTYTVALIAEPNSSCKDTSFATITVAESSINIDFGVETFDCDATSILQLTDLSADTISNIVSWHWEVTYGDVVTVTSNAKDTAFVLPFGAQGTATLTVTSANGCRKTLTKPFQTGGNPPPIDLIRDTIYACAGDSVHLNPDGDASSGFVYSWTPGNLLDDPSAVNPTFVATQTTTFTVSISPTNPVCQATKNVLVIVNPRPTVDLGADQAVCLGDTVKITANASGGTPPYTFSWSGGLSNGQTQQFRPLLPDTFICTVTDANGCMGTDTINIGVNVVPAVIAISDKIAICQGDTAHLNALVNGGTPPITFTWDQGLSNGQMQTVTPTTTTTYRVVATSADGCTATDSVIVNVNPIPSLIIVDTVCAQNLLTYKVDITTNTDSVRTSIGTLTRNGAGSYTISNIPSGQDVTITATFFASGCSRSVTIEGPDCQQCPTINPPISGGDKSICEDATIPALTVTVGMNQTADWYDAPSGGNLLVSGSLSFTPSATGTYFAEARDTLSNCTSDTRTAVTLTINPPPTLAVTADQMTICRGDQVTLTANATTGAAPFTYVWDQGLGSGATKTARPRTTTTYNVTVTDANGCSASGQITIMVNPVPAINFLRTECSTDNTTYSIFITTDGDAVSSDAGTVTDNGGGAFTISGIPADLDVVIVSIFNATNCQSNLPVNAPKCPDCSTIDAPVSGGDQTICEGLPIPALTVTVGANQTADWYDAPTNGNLLLSGSTSFTPTQAGTYYAEARDTLTGCTSEVRTAVTLTINASPTASITADKMTICAGDAAMLTANANGGTAPYTYQWDNGLLDGQNQTVNPTNTTTYNVTITDALGCTGEASIIITVNPSPNIMVTADKTVICAGDSAMLSASATGGATPYTYSWSNGFNGANQTVHPTSTTTYTVTVTDANGCSATADITITVNPAPLARINADKATICVGDSVTLTASAEDGTPPYTFTWDNGLPNGTTQIVSPTQTTTYTVTVTDANGCTDTEQITITVNPALNVTITADNDNLCQGQSATLTVNVGNGRAPFTYQWDNGLPGNQSNTVTPTVTTTYNVTVTDANGCTGMASITITVNPNPVVDATADKTTICAGESATLSASASSGTPPYTFNWSNGASGQNQTVSPTDTTTYVVTVTDANGCMGMDSITINVNPKPSVSVNTEDGRDTICLGESVTLIASASGGTEPYAYQWDNGLGEGATKTVTPTQTTIYKVTVTGANGCSDTASIKITVNPALDVTISTDNDNLCQGQSATLTANVGNGVAPYTYQWDNGLPDGQQQAVTPTVTTTYNVTVTDATGCTGTASITIKVNPNPVVDATADKTTICAGESATLSASASSGMPPYTFNWSNGVSGQNQMVSPSDTTTYVVTVTDANGCTGTDSITINVKPTPTVSITTEDGRTTICLGQSATLIASASGGVEPYTYQWDNGLGEGATKTVTPTQTTTYTVTVTGANGCSSTASITITVTEGLDVSISTENQTLCLGESTTLTANVANGLAPYTYQWDNGLPGNQSNTVTPTVTTTYNITVTDANGCTGMASITITVNPNPIVDATADKTTICAGESATLSASASSGMPPYSYNWSNGASGQNQTVSPSDTTTYVVTVTDANGCTGMDSITINVNPTPTVNVTTADGRDTICLGQSVTLIAIANGGTEPYTYQWDNGLGEGATKTVTPTQTTTYTVTVTGANGCSSTASITITVTEGLDVSISAEDQTLCLGESTTLTANVANGLAPYTYQWDNGLPGNPSNTVTPTLTTTYNVTVTDANGCIGTASITITVNPSPVVDVTADKTTICAGESATLSASASSGTPPYTFNWSNGASGQNQTVSPSDTTTYVVTVTDANGCTGTDSITINVNPKPSVSVTTEDGRDTICLGESVTLIASASGGTEPYTYQWDNGLGEGATKTVTPTQTTTYTVTVTGANGCSSTGQITITVNPALDVTISTDNDNLCQGQSAMLTANVGNGVAPYTYQWDNGLPDGKQQAVTPTVTTTYNVTVTDATGCTGTASITITVNPNPMVTASASDSTVCSGTTTMLNAAASSGTPPYTYNWSDGSTGQNPTVSPTDTTVYTVTVTDANGCTATDDVTVNVYPQVILEVEVSPDTIPICPGETKKLKATATSGDGPFTYQWDNGLGSGDSKEVNPLATTTYTVTVTDVYGCMVSASATVKVSPINATIPEQTIVCLPSDNATLAVTNLDPTQILTYDWSPKTAILSDPTQQSVMVNPNLSNTFSVIVQNQYGCRDTLEGSVTILNLPAKVSATATPDTINLGESSQLEATVNSEDGPFTYQWDNGLGNGDSKTVTPQETTTYTVTVTQGECVATASVTVFVRICNPEVYLPNAFTPNGDGVNDIWRMRSNSIEELQDVQLIVYNRWGQKVFETRDPNVGWDGTFNNRQLPPDVYGYYVHTKCPSGEVYQKQGNVTLLR